jgi:hypothetical protein
MKSLPISALPSLRTEDPTGERIMERDGFVDDSVVLALVAGPNTFRQNAMPEDLALSSDDMDFAGWCLSESLPLHATRAPLEIPRRAALPELEEPGLGEPHHGSHRWWLAGLAGALSTLLFSLLLLSLSSRGKVADQSISQNPVPAAAAPVAVQNHADDAPPELTGIPTEK